MELSDLWQEAVREAAPPPLWGFLLGARVSSDDGGLVTVVVASDIGLDMVRRGVDVSALEAVLGRRAGRRLSLALETSAPVPQGPMAEIMPPPVLPREALADPATKRKVMSRGKAVKGTLLAPGAIEEAEGPVKLQGTLASVEEAPRKDGGTTLRLVVTDHEDSILVKVFLRPNEPELDARPGMRIVLSGDRTYDRFDRQWTVIARDVHFEARPPRHQEGAAPRTELHLHTRFSTLDGITDLDRLFAEARELGIAGVAITDHGVVQAFPEAHQLARKAGVALYFGLEAYVGDSLRPILGPDDVPLGADFVAVDVETTSLSPLTGEVIELGAARFVGGRADGRFQSLVRPRGAVPPDVATLTGIELQSLEAAPPLEEVMPSFLDFVGELPLVAHNASFDRGFLRAAARTAGGRLENSVVDTLALARLLLPDLRNYRLPDVATAFSIPSERHHRADADAEVAGRVALSLAGRLAPAGALTFGGASGRETPSVPGGRPHHGQLLATTSEGLVALYRLVSRSHLDTFHRVPIIPEDSFFGVAEGLVRGASGCPSGEIVRAIVQNDPWDEIVERAARYAYLEVLPPDRLAAAFEPGFRMGGEVAAEVARRVVEAGREAHREVVAVSDAHHIDAEESVFRRIARRSSGQGMAGGDGGHLRTTEEMLAAFDGIVDDPEEIVVRAPYRLVAGVDGGMRPLPDDLHAPRIPGAEESVREKARTRLRSLYPDPVPPEVAERFERELDAILKNGFAPIYHLADRLTSLAQADGEIVGSRGSVGSSFVAFLLGITEVNPLPPHWLCEGCTIIWGPKDVLSGQDLPARECPACGRPMRQDGQNIPFETFLGFDGTKVPDIDLNFSGPYQAVVHRAVEEILGEGQVFRAGTIATVAERTAFGMARGYLEESGRSVRPIEVDRLAKGLIGAKRTTGQHPGGLMIVPEGEDVHAFTPLQHPADDQTSGTITTHFDYHSISSRLLKLDLLGHDDPTVIRHLSELTGIPVASVPLADPKALSIFSSTEALGVGPADIGSQVGTLGLPEFGTKFVRGMLEAARPTTFGELVRISGLSHGTDVWNNNARTLIENGTANLKDVIACRDDIMLFLIDHGIAPETAFRIMENVRRGKGLTGDERSLLAVADVPAWAVESMQKIKYLFPKAHAAAYVTMAARIAWFKVYHPLAFYASYFAIRAEEIDLEAVKATPEETARRIIELEAKRDATAREKALVPILEVVREMRCRGITFEPLSIARADAFRFLPDFERGTLTPPLSVVTGLGRAAAEQIAAARDEQAFTSLEDMRARARISRPVLEILRSEGALGDLAANDQMTLFG